MEKTKQRKQRKPRYAIVAQLAGHPHDTHVVMETCANLEAVRESLKDLLSGEDWQDTTQIWRLRGITKNLIEFCHESATPEMALSVAWWQDEHTKQLNGRAANWLYVTMANIVTANSVWREPTRQNH
jgi:hypothetical protein